ncbi:MAG: LysM peptidoglycan-binding domain-containing protein [Actinomycetota bacterium]
MTLKPIAALLAPVVVGALVLSACGSADEGATLPTLDVSTESTAFIVRIPPSTTTTTAAPQVVGDATDAPRTGPQEYTVQSGDYPLKVASDFDITLDQLVAANGWASADSFPAPNTVIQIPAPTSSDDADQAAVDVDDASEQEDTVATTGDDCAVREYAIEAGDTSRLAVANKFNISVDALDAANAATSGYNAFYPGLLIVIPAGSDC